jgi:hypothetical protein
MQNDESSTNAFTFVGFCVMLRICRGLLLCNKGVHQVTKFDSKNTEHKKELQRCILSFGIDLKIQENLDKARVLSGSCELEELHGKVAEAYGLSPESAVQAPTKEENPATKSFGPKGPKNVSSGRVKEQYMLLVYGVSGVGKSLLGINANDVFCEDIEKGTEQLDVEMRNEPSTYPEIVSDINWFFSSNKKSMLIDSVTFLELKCIEYFCETNGWESMRKGKGTEFGNAYDAVNAELMKLFVSIKNRCSQYKKNVIFTGHSCVRYSPNPQGEDFEKIHVEVNKKLHDKMIAVFDHVFYAHYETTVANLDPKDSDSKVIASTTKRRLLHTGGSPNITSKNRTGLPQIIALPMITATDKKKAEFEKIFAML